MAEDKIARICWNSKHWVRPSGREGKSVNEDSYEFKTGFGHEEWNFDTEKVIDGYVYAFLQQFNTKSNIHVGKTYNIFLYTIQKIKSNKNKKWWLGQIREVEVISKQESKRIHNIYKMAGWLSQMEANLSKLNIDTKAFTETNPDIFVNIRFKIQSINLLDSPAEIEPNDETIPSFYYNLLTYKKAPSLPEVDKPSFIFQPGHNEGKISTHSQTINKLEGKNLLHNKFQTKIFKILEKQFGVGNVGSENQIGYQSKVDLVVRDNQEYIFFELKIAPTAKTAIREALGQILEYSYWPKNNYAKKLVIISPQPSTKYTGIYLKYLRDKFKLPIYYQQYDTESEILKNEI